MVTPDHFIVTTFSVRWILLFLSCTDEETRDFSSAMQLVHRTSLRTSCPRQSLSASHQEQPFRNISPCSLHSSLAYDITSRILTKFMPTLIRFKKLLSGPRWKPTSFRKIFVTVATEVLWFEINAAQVCWPNNWLLSLHYFFANYTIFLKVRTKSYKLYSSTPTTQLSTHQTFKHKENWTHF